MSRQNWMNFMFTNDSNYLEAKFEDFKEVDNKDFWLVQNFRIGEADFNHSIG